MAAAKQHVEVEGRSLALSNLDKVLYPGDGFTKAQIIDYYIRIAPWLPPHPVDHCSSSYHPALPFNVPQGESPD